MLKYGYDAKITLLKGVLGHIHKDLLMFLRYSLY